jgi:hypothetical protein
MNDGFYKLDNEILLHAPNGVHSVIFEISRDTKDQHTYPIDGWYWFDTQEEAYNFFGLQLPTPELDSSFLPINGSSSEV